MNNIKNLEKYMVRECAEIYRNAYREAPWNEKYNAADVENYIADFINSDTRCAYAFVAEEEVAGVALGLIIPGIGSPYFRLEDICIAPAHQRKGCGKQFLELIAERLRLKGCDSILLGTQRDFPSHKFYVKNQFREIDSVLLYKEVNNPAASNGASSL